MASLKEAIEDLFNNPLLTAEEAVDRHFAPAFRQRVNGSWIDRASFLAAIVSLRASVDRVEVTVLDELSEGSRYAERHLIDLAKRDGKQLRQEVYVFAQRAEDGRFDQIEETTLALGA
ncbi:nuclear transport factor 2 family protein [Herbaspirillum seropedicae]|uniref:nuclear transport factor 2 family protein n=1 Tax=Herbaspirillum seropedicae TaxID=964 RepID=UPI0031E45C74